MTDKWRSIKTIPEYISWVEIKFANGETTLCPWPPVEPTQQEKADLANKGVRPDYKNYTPVEWRITDVPEPKIAKPRGLND